MNVSQLKPSNGFIERRSLMVRMSFTFRPIATAVNHCLHWAFLDLHTGTAQEHQGWEKACPSAVIFLAHLEPPSSASGDCQRIWLWLVSWFYLGLYQNMLLPVPMDFLSIIQSEIGHQFWGALLYFQPAPSGYVRPQPLPLQLATSRDEEAASQHAAVKFWPFHDFWSHKPAVIHPGNWKPPIYEHLQMMFLSKQHGDFSREQCLMSLSATKCTWSHRIPQLTSHQPT